jgi:centrosomal protein CEP41
MKSFKNKEDKLIILYHLDEKNGIKMANHCFEKGYDNIYLLTGGVEEFTQEAHDLVQGTQVPPLLKKTSTSINLTNRNRPQDTKEIQL